MSTYLQNSILTHILIPKKQANIDIPTKLNINIPSNLKKSYANASKKLNVNIPSNPNISLKKDLLVNMTTQKKKNTFRGNGVIGIILVIIPKIKNYK